MEQVEQETERNRQLLAHLESQPVSQLLLLCKLV